MDEKMRKAFDLPGEPVDKSTIDRFIEGLTGASEAKNAAAKRLGIEFLLPFSAKLNAEKLSFLVLLFDGKNNEMAVGDSSNSLGSSLAKVTMYFETVLRDGLEAGHVESVILMPIIGMLRHTIKELGHFEGQSIDGNDQNDDENDDETKP